MRSSLVFLTLHLVCLTVSVASDPVTFTTESGRELKDAEVSKVELDSVTFTFSGGVVRIPIEDIPSEIRTQLGLAASRLLDSEVDSLEELQGILEQELEGDRKEASEFEATYQKYLRDLREESKKAGQLDQVLMVDKELETFQDDRARDYSEFPELNRLRTIFEARLPEAMSNVMVKRNQTMRFYLSRLADMKRSFTQKGELDAAMKVAEEEKRIEMLIKAELLRKKPVKIPTEGPFWTFKSLDDEGYFKVGGIVIEPEGKGWRLEKGQGLNTMLGAHQEIYPPFRIVARLSPLTDGEVRFGYCGRFIARFNMGDSDTLQLAHPGGTKVELRDQGALQPGEASDLEMRVYPGSVEAYVNGELRGTLEADYANVEKGNVGELYRKVAISPFRDCPVLLESFEIWPLEED